VDVEFQASPCYRARPCLKKERRKKRRNPPPVPIWICDFWTSALTSLEQNKTKKATTTKKKQNKKKMSQRKRLNR
jgi:hypothetical protein